MPRPRKNVNRDSIPKPKPTTKPKTKRGKPVFDDGYIKEVVENAWLGLGDTTKIQVGNPFDKRTANDLENPARFLIRLMREPDYFFFTAKHLLGKSLPPFELAILRELWTRPFPMLIGSRGMGKSFILALYIVLRLTITQGVKIVVVGAGFRQAKVIYEYCEEIWRNAPVLRDIAGNPAYAGPKKEVDRCQLRIGDSIAIFLPMGDGSKIRGQRANILIADEFASISNETFENVVSGFAVVSKDPIEKLKFISRKKALTQLGLINETAEEVSVPGLNSNQTILSGTAYYGFNHFFSYWQRWKKIIESQGDRRKLEEIFRGEIPEKFCWKDYSIIRMPVTLLPEGFMDEKHVAKAKATIHLSQYLMEFGACFALDSNGFYRRSLIESCVVGKLDRPITFASCGEVIFTAVLRGDPNRRYVMAVDPASEKDNFSIVILEVWPDHRRIVHCWTTTRKRHKAKFSKGLVKEEDFYSYAARRIRDLMVLFPCERIALDTQGGGVAVMEALADRARLLDGERPIYPVIDDEKPRETDNMAGDHILELVEFARANWVSEANHGMRKDFEDKVLLFPEFDPAVLGLAIEEDKIKGRIKVGPDGEEKLYDTLEDCMMEIEELKDELATIVHTQSGQAMRDRWDTPEVKLVGGKKGRLRKDRYSALLMANMAARCLQRLTPRADYAYLGGFAHDLSRTKKEHTGLIRPSWENPDWYTRGSSQSGYGIAVRR